jgi:hypothetical protein
MVVYKAMITQMIEPKTIQETLSILGRELWKSVMQEEYDSLMENKTWKLVDRLHNQKTVKSKWRHQCIPTNSWQHQS